MIATHSRRKLRHAAARVQPRPWQVRRSRGQTVSIGLIMCPHYIAGRSSADQTPTTRSSTLCDATSTGSPNGRGSFDHIGIGSDLDGFIKPALPGLRRTWTTWPISRTASSERYGAENAEKITSGNALRMLRYRFG